jgi:hypothetical protein
VPEATEVGSVRRHDAIAERYSQEVAKNEDTERIAQRRAELEAEQKRLVTAFTKGYLDEKDLDAR